jgi:PEP-CTERM/exosortase A-associated glycosyltransferase
LYRVPGDGPIYSDCSVFWTFVRILHVLDHSIPLHSGYAFRTRAIVAEQRARGWETEHLTGPKHDAHEALVEQVDGLRFFRTDRSSVLHRFPALNQYGVIRDLERRLAAVAAEVRPDLIHAHSPALNGVAAVRVARRLRLPLVYEMRASWEDAAVDHGTTTEGSLRYKLSRRLETWVLRRADHVTTICEGLRKDIASRGIAADKVTVIPNAVDVARFRLADARDVELAGALDLKDHRVLGFIGSFYGYEGLALLVEAMPAVVAKIPDARLLLVGGGFEDERIRAMVRSSGLDDVVRFTGRVPNAQVHRYYSLCDVMVYPRLSMRLTELVTPLKPLEAMAQGKLVVASDVGGHKELIRHGETGILFRSGDVRALGDAVTGLLADPGSWPAMVAAGRRFVEEERTWAASVARYAPVFDRLTRNGTVFA